MLIAPVTFFNFPRNQLLSLGEGLNIAYTVHPSFASKHSSSEIGTNRPSLKAFSNP